MTFLCSQLVPARHCDPLTSHLTNDLLNKMYYCINYANNIFLYYY
jgi:hypothetical protein